LRAIGSAIGAPEISVVRVVELQAVDIEALEQIDGVVVASAPPGIGSHIQSDITVIVGGDGLVDFGTIVDAATRSAIGAAIAACNDF
jgi:hypothetical protein